RRKASGCFAQRPLSANGCGDHPYSAPWSLCSPHSFRNNVNKLLYPERLFHAGSAGLAQGGDGFFIGDVARDENNSGNQVGTVLGDPAVHLGTVDATGSSHVGNDAEKIAMLE